MRSLAYFLAVLVIPVTAHAHGGPASEPGHPTAVFSGAPRGGLDTSLLGNPDEVDARGSTMGLRAPLFGASLKGGLEVQLGGYVHRGDPLLGVSEDEVTVGSFTWEASPRLSTESAIFLELFVGGSLSLFHSISGAYLPGRPLEGTWVACASESDLAARLGFRFGEDLHVRLRLQVQGDPFHIGDGRACLGDPTYWVQGQASYLEVALALGPGASIRLSAGYEASSVFYDLPAGAIGRDQAFGEIATAGWVATIGIFGRMH